MAKTYEDGYREGFKDGYDRAVDHYGAKEKINPNILPYEQHKLYSVVCPKCGIDFSSSTGYVCSNYECPIQLRVT